MNTTKEYGKFKFRQDNRDISPKRIEKLKKSIQAIGYIKSRPIIVDENFNILDGQARVMALKELEMEIPYEMEKGKSAEKMIALNASQENWKLEDYIKSYATQGKNCYRQLLKFQDKFHLGITNSISVALGSGIKAQQIRDGKEFELKKDAEEVAEYILELKAAPFYKQQSFVTAVSTIYRKLSTKDRNKLKSNILAVPKRYNVEDYLTVFENLLNYKRREENKISL